MAYAKLIKEWKVAELTDPPSLHRVKVITIPEGAIGEILTCSYGLSENGALVQMFFEEYGAFWVTMRYISKNGVCQDCGNSGRIYNCTYVGEPPECPKCAYQAEFEKQYAYEQYMRQLQQEEITRQWYEENPHG